MKREPEEERDREPAEERKREPAEERDRGPAEERERTPGEGIAGKGTDDSASLRPFVQVRLGQGQNGIFFGPGKAGLLAYIEQTGSMQEACAEMGLSYSKGSRMIKKTEKILGCRLLERWTGGSGGGGSRLTEEGRDLLQKYRIFVRRLQEESDRIFAEVFTE